MTRRRVWRFLLEAAFLAVAAAVATVAELRPTGVIVLMALAWIVVALFEWTAWLDEPHFGRGLPPRFYVPQVSLPPPRPVEQLQSAYPPESHEDDATTWVVSAQEWATALDEWPVLPSSPVDEETQIAIPDEPPPEFPPEIKLSVLSPPPRETAHRPAEEELDEDEEEYDELDEDEASEDEAADEGVVAEALPEPEPTPVAEPAPPPPAPVEAPPPLVAEQPAPKIEIEPPAAPAPAPPPLPELTPIQRMARHRIDPISSAPRRRLRRAPRDAGGTAELPDGPPAGRALPSNSQDEPAGGSR